MKRYEIEQRDPTSIEIDGFVRLLNPETGRQVAAVYVGGTMSDDMQRFDLDDESVRHLRQLAAAPAMEGYVKLMTGSLTPEEFDKAQRLGKTILNYIETGEEI